MVAIRKTLNSETFVPGHVIVNNKFLPITCPGTIRAKTCFVLLKTSFFIPIYSYFITIYNYLLIFWYSLYMIGYINGKIINTTIGEILINVNDIGYVIFTTSTLSLSLTVGQNVELFIKQIVREQSLDLYGFSELQEKNLFENLINVSGIGPKSALNILSILTPNEFKNCILENDPVPITRANGIGKKGAEKIIIELRNKIGKIITTNTSVKTQNLGTDIVDALIGMGYSFSQARIATQDLPNDETDIAILIRYALKKLNT